MLVAPPARVKMLPVRLYIGTSTATGASRGIYSVEFDPSSGSFGTAGLVAETPNPTFLAFGPGGRCLYAVTEYPSLVAGYRIGPEEKLTPIAAPSGPRAKAPSHLSIDLTGRMAVVSHYHSGFVAAVALESDGAVGAVTDRIAHAAPPGGPRPGANPQRQETPHVHSAIFSPDNRRLAVCDLGLDRIDLYRPAAAGKLGEVVTRMTAAAGAGPRHSVFSPDGRTLYVANELNSTVSAFDSEWGGAALQVVSTLPAGFAAPNLCAEIRQSADSRHLYVSNRGHDSIAHFRRDPATGQLEFAGAVSCGGRHPRHFSLSPDGRWIVCANRDTDSLTALRRDGDSGSLQPSGSSSPVPQPVCVIFAG